jgi:UDP-N-acetylmuramate--alanine ligase
MKALAEVLLDRGWKLTGSDLNPPNAQLHRLISRGLIFHQGHSAANINESIDAVVYSPAVPFENVERRTAAILRRPEWSYSAMVGQLMRQATGVCIAGTHGKSTTTAMTATILDSARRLSAVVHGAELCDGGRSGWSGSGDLFVAESCEFQHSFLDFHPRYAAILSVQADHFDCYPDLGSLKNAFIDFAGQIADDGVLLSNADCPVSGEVAVRARTQAKRVSFGTVETANWQARELEECPLGMRFRLYHNNVELIPIQLAIHGEHNVWNALAAAALCSEIGVSPELIQSSLARFRGIRRRLETVGEWKGATLIDDYAHHPTAVRVTLQTLRSVFPDQPIRCIFQPHQILRTRSLMTDFAASFADADEVIVAPVFAAREAVSDEPAAVSRELAERIRAQGVSASFQTSLDQIVSTLDDATHPGDVIVTMGAGDIDRIHHELTQRI